MEIGIAYDRKIDIEAVGNRPDDWLEEYDSEETIAGIADALHANG